MAVAAPKDLAPSEWWLRPLQWAGLAVWLAIPVFMYFYIYRPWAAHVLWSIFIAGLPLFIILIGYHRWRLICPLAFFSQIPVRLRRPGGRRASPWLEERYYYIMFGFLLIGLWLRLTVINGVGEASAAFFVLLSLAALVTGALFTGKTWCNYICPVSLIEKINTEPFGLRESPNSQCAKCTACKKSCPDINEENGYWKEISLRSKRFAYYAFPGLVFTFYLYFYLQAGTWDYYFNGGWVDQPHLIYRAFRADDHPMSFGFFFWPELPRSVAAMVTLLIGSVLSYALFSWFEPRMARSIRRQQPEADDTQVRHLMFTIAAFVSFLNFYAFAGQPLLRMVPWLGALGGIFAAVVGTLFLARRYARTQKAFAEQTVALSIIKRWEWPDMRPPKDLHEALLVHQARSSERKTGYAQVMEAYKDAVRETLADGFVTREDIQRLESLRNQLQIKKADHEKIMSSLAEEERALLADPSQRPSAEKLLQLTTYRRALEQHMRLVLAADARADDQLVRQLQNEFNVTEEEHAAALDGILGGAQGIAARVAEGIQRDAHAHDMLRALAVEPSPSHTFLADLLRRRRAHAVERIMRVLHVDPDSGDGRAIYESLCADDDADREKALAALHARATPAVAERMAAIRHEIASAGAGTLSLVDGLREYTAAPDPYVRAAAAYALAERGALGLDLLRRLAEDDHELVRETLEGLTARLATKPEGAALRLTRLEKMIALRSVPIFASIEPESLAELARFSTEETYAPGQIVVREGEQGEDAFIIMSGKINVVLKAGTPEEIFLSERSTGDILGEMAVFDPGPRSATMRVGANSVRVLRLSGAALREVLRADPGTASGIIRTLVRRLRARLGQIEAEQEAG